MCSYYIMLVLSQEMEKCVTHKIFPTILSVRKPQIQIMIKLSCKCLPMPCSEQRLSTLNLNL